MFTLFSIKMRILMLKRANILARKARDKNREKHSKREIRLLIGESTGPYPLFVPEADAVLKAIVARENICSLL